MNKYFPVIVPALIITVLFNLGCYRTYEASLDAGSDSDAELDTDTDYEDSDTAIDVDIDADTSGNLIWAKNAGGSMLSFGVGITALSDGSALLTGNFHGAILFGSGEANETELTSTASFAFFVAKYNPDGTFAWAKSASGSDNSGNGIVSLTDGSALVTGEFRGTTVFGQGEANETELLWSGGCDIFIVKYNSDGTLAWAKSAGSTGCDHSNDITALSDGSSLITGNYAGTTVFGLGEANETELFVSNDEDVNIFVAKYSPDGTLDWAKNAGGNGLDSSTCITVLSDESALVIGWFEESAIFGQGETNETELSSTRGSDIFVAKYTPAGTLAWAKSVCSSELIYSADITTLADDSVLMTGYFSETVVFGPGDEDETELSSAGGTDIFIARYHPDATLAWVKGIGGESEESGTGITELSDGSILVTGYSSEIAQFDPEDENETERSSVWEKDIFIAKYHPDATLAWSKTVVGESDDFSSDITTLSDGSVLVTGYFNKTAVFGPGEENETELSSAGDSDLFIAKFAP
ncbi:MAG: hypothetical protein GY847_39545 [Proteobacteria bacterium]|nr:hypothetical protein [Pseudomonadota bacterium]